MKQSRRNYKKSERRSTSSPKSKPRSRESKEFEINVPDSAINRADMRPSEQNDVSWYTKNSYMLKDSASFPFSIPVGNKIPWNYHSTPAFTASNVNVQSIPGIMICRYIPTVGWADSFSSPVNVAARSFYGFVRHENSGHTNYESTDLMMYLLAMDSVYTYYSEITRLYGLMMGYKYTNKYYPKAIIEGLGYDFDDINANLAQLRYYIDSYAAKASSMCIPSDMAYMKRHAWLPAGMYTDSANSKAQTYMWQPEMLYKYVERNLNPDDPTQVQPAKLQAVLTASRGLTNTNNKAPLWKIADIRAFGDSLLDPIWGSEDMNIMSGDILKAFGLNNIFSVAPITSEYQVVPTYSTEVLSQIENAYFAGNVEVTDITQDVSLSQIAPILKQSITTTLPTQTAAELMGNESTRFNRLINFHAQDVTPEMMMVATRMISMSSKFTGGSHNLDVCGTEVATTFDIIYFYNPGNVWQPGRLILSSDIELRFDQNSFSVTGDLGYTQGMYTLRYGLTALSTLSTFDWHPIVYLTANGTHLKDDGSIVTYVESIGPICDVDNYSVLTASDLVNMHETALLSEFTLPQLSFTI